MSLRSVFVVNLLLVLFAASLPAAQRQVVLVEGFTNTSCVYCATYNPAIRNLMTAMTRDTCVKINYHVWWPGSSDPMYLWNTSELQARTNYYGVTGVPAIFVDYSSQPDISNPAAVAAAIRTRYQTSSPCTITVSATPSGTTSFSFTASVTADQNMTGTNYRLYVALINDLITYSTPPGSNGETIFPDVFRDFNPNANAGQSFSISAGQTYELNGTLNRDAAWLVSNCSVIAFVQNSSTREILQAQWAHVNAGTITLVSPNGGESWVSGESHSINWTSANFTDNIRIQIMRDFPSGSWQSIASSTPNTGSYSWTVTAPGSTTARIRLTGAAETAVSDTSNANFTIAGITVTAPQGGETLYIGEATNITWSAPGTAEAMRIELNRSYPGGAWETLASSAPNTGSFLWTATATASASARIRIVGTVHTQMADTSDGNFAIAARTVTVTSPNGGELWTAPDVHNITWTWQNVTGMFSIELNRNYPAGTWETLATGVPPSGSFPWVVSSPASASARVRVTSLSYPAAMDISNGNFTVVVPNLAPTLKHDALCDFAPGTGQVVALARDPSLFTTIASVKMFYRLRGQIFFDSLALSPTGNPDEYSASLAALPAGSYDYYVRALDDGGIAAAVPASAPARLYRFAVYPLCVSSVLGYDDGTAEAYNWVVADSGAGFQWAVKFGPVTTPFALCGAQFAASRSLPDTLHTPVYAAIYAADGPGGLPGTLLYGKFTGSVGNALGGLPSGTNWARVSFDDTLGVPPVLNVPEFYVAIGNVRQNEYEGIGRDTSSANAHRSYFFDGCTSQWHSEDDTVLTQNAHPGNRMIRAFGAPLALTLIRNGNDLVLRWADLGAPQYRIYSAANSSGPYDTLEGISPTNSYTIVNGAGGAALRRFYTIMPIPN